MSRVSTSEQMSQVSALSRDYSLSAFDEPVLFAGGLINAAPVQADRDFLVAHLGRKTLHGSVDRSFEKSFTKTPSGGLRPRMYRTSGGYEALQRCQYVKLTHPQRAAVIVIDIDRPGESGGSIQHLHPKVLEGFELLVTRGIGPAWVGINPLSGKAQAIWLIDPVYTGANKQSRNARLLKRCTEYLARVVYGDLHFSHGFSRNPLYTGPAEGAYRWYCQHRRIDRVGDVMSALREITGEKEPEKQPQNFRSGSELLAAVIERRETAEAFKTLAEQAYDPDADARLDKIDSSLVGGVRVLWLSQGRAARDETGFKHALKTAYRLRKAGKPLKDNWIIDAYEHGYNIAQTIGADGRAPEMPPVRDRQTMARRVRGYVYGGKVNSNGCFISSQGVNEHERSALATLGRRGGRKAAQRWKTDPDGEYASAQRQTMQLTHKRKMAQGIENQARVQAFAAGFFRVNGRLPTRREIMDETKLSRASVTRHLSALRAQNLLPET